MTTFQAQQKGWCIFVTAKDEVKPKDCSQLCCALFCFGKQILLYDTYGRPMLSRWILQSVKASWGNQRLTECFSASIRTLSKA